MESAMVRQAHHPEQGRGIGSQQLRIFVTCLAILAVGFVAPPEVLLAGSDTSVTAITAPSADVTLSFVQPGRIANVRVREGEAVTVGQVLIELDDAVDRVRLAQLEASSQDTIACDDSSEPSNLSIRDCGHA